MTSHLAGAADAGMADARSCASPPPSGLASWDVHECSPEMNELARVLLYKWLKHHEATSPKVAPHVPALAPGRAKRQRPRHRAAQCVRRIHAGWARGSAPRRRRLAAQHPPWLASATGVRVPPCAPPPTAGVRACWRAGGAAVRGLTVYRAACCSQEIGTDVNENTYHAAMVYLVERSAFLKQRAAQRAVAGADAAARAQEGGQASIQDIVAGTETTVWQFFKAMTKVLELAEREQWLTALVPDLKLFVHEFKHIEVKFMFVYMLHEKLKKVLLPAPPRRNTCALDL